MPFFENSGILFIHIPKTGGTSIEKFFSRISNTPLNAFSLYYRHTPNIQDEIDTLRKKWRAKINGKINKQLSFILHKSKNDLSLPTDIQNSKKLIPAFQECCRIKCVRDEGHSLQHFTWNELRKHQDTLFTLDQASRLFNKSTHYKIITVVRNPYDRILSELFFIKRIHINMSNIEIYERIHAFLTDNEDYDNHKIPQYQYLLGENGDIINNVQILRMESLTRDMTRHGYGTFAQVARSNSNTQYDNKKYMRLLNRQSIQVINEYYKKDFELFGYPMITKPVP